MALNDQQEDGQQLELDFSIIDPKMAIRAMRDSGYKSTTHAIAELIDNSIESGADSVEVFGLSRYDDSTQRLALKELAVLDNGNGMDADTLRGALRYGHGTRRERRGIGRFGMGLPNSSMSQARQLDVWSWQSGVTNALHTRLHLDDIEAGVAEIPEPTLRALPREYIDASLGAPSDTGTLVLWRDLDRVQWKRASTTFKHTAYLIGRIYRRFLAKPSERLHPDDPRSAEIMRRCNITLVPIDVEDTTPLRRDDDVVKVKPNDPLYLMSGTSCPELFGPGPMFQELAGFSPFTIAVPYGGQSHDVQVRASYARPHVRDPDEAGADWPKHLLASPSGATPWGKHANQNLGVSIVRAHREIHLDASWANQSDPRERWWKVEVDFPTALDEVFGVTNDKQGVVNFQRLAAFDWRRVALENETTRAEVILRMREEGDPSAALMDLHEQIGRCIRKLRPLATEARRRRAGHEVASTEEYRADAKASAAIRRRVEEGYRAASELAAEHGSEVEHKQKQLDNLKRRHHFDEEDALRRVDETIRTGSRVRWILSEEQGPAFFEVEPLPNVTQVVFNTNHPVYAHLWHAMHPFLDDHSTEGEDGPDNEELAERLERAAMAFRILIYAWARFEDEQSGRDRRDVRDARDGWGKFAEAFFDDLDDEPAPTDLV